jgi:hypothetical protein
MAQARLKRYESEEDFAPIAEEPAPYVRSASGEYLARCTSRKLERLRIYGGAWKLRLMFQIIDLDQNPTLAKFFHLGRGDRPNAGRKSNYWPAWIIANGGQMPRRGQTMSPRVFLDKNFLVRVADVQKRWDHAKHVDGEIYSTVAEILELR